LIRSGERQVLRKSVKFLVDSSDLFGQPVLRPSF
jgi:hypothetical protein